jgi:hypothetical protein
MKIDWKTTWIYFIQILAGIALGFILAGCKSSKSGCDAYSNMGYKYCIEGKVIYRKDTVDAIALTDQFTSTHDSVYYYNSDSSLVSFIAPYTVYENIPRKQR